jgi:hypothetical protein
MRVIPTVLSISILSCIARAQNYTISTFAGGALTSNVPGTTVRPADIGGVAVDAKGNLFFTNSNAVYWLDIATGLISPVAGTGNPG